MLTALTAPATPLPCATLTTGQSASLALQGEVKRGSPHLEPQVPPNGGGEAPTARSEFFTAPTTLIERAGLPVLPALQAPGVHSFCTTRLGGAGRGPHESLNLGTQAGDDPAVVAENRRRLRAALPGEPFWLTQVHGARVLDADDPIYVDAAVPREADAAITSVPGRVLAVMAADCLPVVMADLDAQVLGAAHAGWRGLAAGVLEQTLSALRARRPDARGWQAWIGPGIGPDAFEVGAEVRAAFACLGDEALTAFAPYPGRSGKWLANLPALAELRLRRAGVAPIHQAGLCTVGHPDLFFSYRRDGVTGRMAACAWLENAAAVRALDYPD